MQKQKELTFSRLSELVEYDATRGTFKHKGSDDFLIGGLTKGGYRILMVDGKHYLAHRLAWLYVQKEWPPKWVEHVNGNRDDNRWCNLRLKKHPSEYGELTLERLKEVLDYSPITGWFVWKRKTSRTNIGDRAGVVSGFGYRFMSVDGHKFLAHRLAWFYVHGIWPTNLIDHINGDRDDNRLINLREATYGQNTHNSKASSRNTTGYKGVSRYKNNKFKAQITANYQIIPLGVFDTAEEAHKAYVKASEKYHKDFRKK